jgi:hypothetical protein
VAAVPLNPLVQRVVIWVVSFTGFLVYLRMRPNLQALSQENTPQLSAAEA